MSVITIQGRIGRANRSAGPANFGRGKSISAGTAFRSEQLERAVPGVTEETATAAGGVDFLLHVPIDETYRVEKRHHAPHCLYPVMSSTTSAPQSPEHSYDDETATTPHQPPPEKYASIACTYLETRKAYQADQRPDNGEIMALQCD